VALGVGMLARPALVPRPSGLGQAEAQRVHWLARLTGGRDLALGAGALAAARSPAQRLWVAAGVLSDAVDAVVLTRAVRNGDVGRLMGGLAAASAVGAAALGAVAVVQPPGRTRNGEPRP
jgi:hypothetical protein